MILKSWVNGKDSNRISIQDRGLLYGDGLFETIKISSNQLTLASYHWKRLSIGLKVLSINIDIELIIQEVQKFLFQNIHKDKDVILKVIITRSIGSRGYNPNSCTESTRILVLNTFNYIDAISFHKGIKLFPCQTKVPSSNLAGCKHLNRLDNILARAEWCSNEYKEGLMFDFEGYIVEGTMANIFWLKNNKVYTPDLSHSGVDGVCRQFVLDFFKEKKKIVQYVKAKESSLMLADEVFMCNSVIGIFPIVMYKDKSWEIGSITKNIQNYVWKVLYA